MKQFAQSDSKQNDDEATENAELSADPEKDKGLKTYRVPRKRYMFF